MWNSDKDSYSIIKNDRHCQASVEWLQFLWKEQIFVVQHKSLLQPRAMSLTFNDWLNRHKLSNVQFKANATTETESGERWSNYDGQHAIMHAVEIRMSLFLLPFVADSFHFVWCKWDAYLLPHVVLCARENNSSSVALQETFGPLSLFFYP